MQIIDLACCIQRYWYVHSRSMSLDGMGSLLLLLSIEIRRKKTLRNFLSARLETNCHFEAYNPSLWGINIVAKHEIRCEVLLRSSPTAAWREGPNALDTVSVFSFPNANMSVFHERALVYHLRVIFLNTRLREPQLNNSKHVPCSSLARSAPQDPVTVVRLKSPFNFPQSGYSNTLARGIK